MLSGEFRLKAVHWVLNDKPYCLHCYAVESMVPCVDGGYKKRIAQLRDDLVHKYHYCNAWDMADTEVEDAYDRDASLHIPIMIN